MCVSLADKNSSDTSASDNPTEVAEQRSVILFTPRDKAM